MIEYSGKLIMHRFQIYGGKRLSVLFLLAYDLILPSYDIARLYLVDLPVAEIRENFCSDNMLLRVLGVFFQAVFHIDYVGFDKAREAHIQTALFLEKLFAFPLLRLTFGGKSAFLRLL